MSVKKDLATIEGHLEPINHSADGIAFDNTGTVLANDNVQDVIEELVKGPTSATDNAITRYDGITGKLVQDSKAYVQDGGAVQAQAFVGNREIIEDVVIPDKHTVIATDIVLLTGNMILEGDAELFLI